MAATATNPKAIDGSTANDNFTKNDSGCCIYVPLPESPVKEIATTCVDDCGSVPTNPCGMVHPDGSGTLAGCKSTTLPHFGVTMNKRAGKCRQFGYYTSGNVDEYENECGSIDKLTHTVKTKPCTKETTYAVESCDCFDGKTKSAANKAAAATNAATIAAKHP